MSNKGFNPQSLVKAQEKADAATKHVKELKAKAANYYNGIVTNAMKAAVKKGLMPRKYFDEILDKCVTSKSQREFMGLEPLPPKVESNGQQPHQPQEQNHHQADHNGGDRVQQHQHQPEYQHN